MQHRDITDRVKAEGAQRAAESNFRAVVEQIYSGVYITQDGEYAYVNPRSAEIMGAESGTALVGTNPLEWVVEADRDRVAENLRTLFVGEEDVIAQTSSARAGHRAGSCRNRTRSRQDLRSRRCRGMPAFVPRRGLRHSEVMDMPSPLPGGQAWIARNGSDFSPADPGNRYACSAPTQGPVMHAR